MKNKSKIQENFEKQMGLNHCNFKESTPTLRKSSEITDGICKNSYEEYFICKLTIDSQENKIIKSECEKLE